MVDHGFGGKQDLLSLPPQRLDGLALAVITEDFRKWRYVRDNAEFGLGYVNLPSIGAEVHLPFGGVKDSGNGHPGAEGLISSVTHRVSWTVNHDTKIVLAQGLTADG